MKIASSKPEQADNSKTARQLLVSQALIEHGKYDQARAILEPILRDYSPGEDPTPALQQAVFLYAEMQRLSGHFIEAYNNYCIIFERDQDLAALCLPGIFHCFAHLDSFTHLENVQNSPLHEKHLVSFLEDKDTDNELIENLVISSLKQHYQFQDPDYPVELAEISSHALLLAALPKLCLGDFELELFLIDLRSFLLTTIMEQGLNNKLIGLVIALGLRGFHNGYVNYTSEKEIHLVQAMQLMLDSYLNKSEDLEPVIHLITAITMYIPLNELPQQKLLATLTLEQWPLPLKEAAQLMMIYPQQERKIAQDLPSLSKINLPDISDATSQKVRQEYEAMVSPRWQKMPSRSTAANYLSYYPYLQKTIQHKGKFKGASKCLVAGDGTGRHSVSMAKNIDRIKMTSIDLSRASLAYGARMASSLALKNIKFVHGDVLDARQLDQQFDIIECVGVLHHMDNPMQGLKALLGQLKPKGLIKLGIYSKLARSEITKIRTANAKVKMTPSLKHIREFRYEIMKNPGAEIGAVLEKLPAFHSLSGCQALLFHEREHQFTIPEIQAFLDSHKLRFLGFSDLSPALINTYKNEYPKDVNMLDLSQWHQFEENNPQLFKKWSNDGMYQFHCQKGAA